MVGITDVTTGSGTAELVPGKLQANVAMIKAATTNTSSCFNFMAFSSGHQ
jgi:hypothetical protein